MKKILASFLLSALCMGQFAYAANTANIKIRINGPITDNRYFLCIPDVGCLSMLAAKKGKVFPFYRTVEMNTLFVTNVLNNRLYNQGLPKSCQVKVDPNKTITISGTLYAGQDQVKLSKISCSVA